MSHRAGGQVAPVPGIVFTDVDGTLVGADHQPIPESGPIIRRVVATGVPFCMVSARMPEALYPIQCSLGFSGPLVCYSGAYVLDEAGEVLLSRTIPIDAAVSVKRRLAEELPGLCCSTYGYHTWVVDDDHDSRVRNEERIVHVRPEVAPDIRGRFGEGGVHKFLLMGDPAPIAAAEEAVSTAYPDLTVVRSSPILLEVMSGDAGKAEGVGAVCDRYGIDRSRAVAFGDGYNDIDMLEAVDESYAMANAAGPVKRVARHVLPWANVDNGVARAVEGLVLR